MFCPLLILKGIYHYWNICLIVSRGRKSKWKSSHLLGIGRGESAEGHPRLVPRDLAGIGCAGAWTCCGQPVFTHVVVAVANGDALGQDTVQNQSGFAHLVEHG